MVSEAVQMAPLPTDAWLDETLLPDEAAEFLKVEVLWLQRSRCDGTGPKFVRLTPRQIVYVRRDLLEWRDAKKHGSTAEYRQPADPEADP